MKFKIILFLIIFSISGCSKKGADEDGETTPPVLPDSRKDSIDKSQEKVAVRKYEIQKVEVEAIKEFQQKISMQVMLNSPEKEVEDFFNFKIDYSKLSLQGMNKIKMIAAQMGNLFKKGFKFQEMVREFVPYNLRKIVESIRIKKRLLVADSKFSSNDNKRVYVYFTALDPAKFQERLARGEFGIYDERSWGGILSFKGVISSRVSQKNRPDIFVFNQGSDFMLTSRFKDLQIYFAVLRNYDKKFNNDTWLAMKIRKVTEALGPNIREFSRELNLPRSFVRFFDFFKHARELDIKVHKETGDKYLLSADFEFPNKGIKNFNQRKLIEEALTKKDLSPLYKYIPLNSISYCVDKTDFTILTRQIKPLISKLSGYSKLNNSKSRALGKVVTLLSRVIKIMDNYDQGMASSIHYAGKNLALGGVFATSSKAKANEFNKNLKGFLQMTDPAGIAKWLPSKDKKELKEIAKILKTKVRNRRYRGSRGFEFSLNVNWKNINVSTRSDKKLKEFAQNLFGKKIRIVFLQKGNNIYFAGGKTWKKEIKRLWKPGKSINIAKNITTGFTPSSVGGINFFRSTMLFTKTLVSYGQIKKNSTLNSELQKTIKYMSNLAKDNWAVFSMGAKTGEGMSKDYRLEAKFDKGMNKLAFFWPYIVFKIYKYF
ncbi:MAG: hypothetical protein PF689_04965 [Deltaproteobacteria bacterium]|jgi:hypothetical protein|nr:hypothetical protein [Deltaproteobacteria bacterium]